MWIRPDKGLTFGNQYREEMLDEAYLKQLADLNGEGDTSLIDQLVELYAEQVKLWPAELQQALDANDPEQVAALAHRNKGASGSAGVAEVAALMDRWHTLAKAGDLMTVRQEAQDLPERLGRSVEALKDFQARLRNGDAPVAS